jgi:hypothetical protein
MHVCMYYVRTYICMHECVYVCITYMCAYVCTHISTACMYVLLIMYLCVNTRMSHVSMYTGIVE